MTHDLFEDLAIRVCDPAFVVMITTGTFTKDAEILAKNSGVVTKSGAHLAKFLADNGVGLDDVGEFTVVRANRWLEVQSHTVGNNDS